MPPETDAAAQDPFADPALDPEAPWEETAMAAPVGIDEDAALAEAESLANQAAAEAEAEVEAAKKEAAALEATEIAAQEELTLDEEAEPAAKRPKIELRKAIVAPKPVPRDQPLWLWLDSLNSTLQGYALSFETLALASDGSKRKGLYTQADRALQTLLGEEARKIVFQDDSDWSKFRCVGDALKTRGEKEECFTIAISPALSLWGIGVGMKGWVRHRAAKIALATVVAMQKAEVGEEIPDFTSAPAVADFLEEARKAKDELLYS
ncbi:TUBA3 [Symbiodinium pilosum]|uniref:TUBA3 protein n=1 Tax=Symbiodinium pilosum TaxID=2952 RepID=A0A812T8T2_SYMPI|nr:TUBA3 [Symbiodinium pilosum]